MIAQYKNEFQVSLNRFFEQQLADARTQLVQQGLSPAEIERKLESMRFVVGSELGMLGSYVGQDRTPGREISLPISGLERIPSSIYQSLHP